MRQMTVACLCALLLAPGFLSAEDQWTTVPGPGVIDSVTVYQNRAMIVRSIARDFSPGLYVIQLADLPAQLLEDSVRAAGRGTAAAKILDIRVVKGFMSESGRQTLREVERKIEEVELRIQEVGDRLEVLGRKAEFIRAVSALKAPDDKGTAIVLGGGSAEWAKTLSFVDSQLTEILGQVRRLTVEKKELEKKRSALRYDLDQQASLQAKERKTILVDLEVTRAGSEKVDVSYVVPGISWAPSYDLRVRSAGTEAVLTYQALVKQDTGEDWNDVELALSTASPALEKSAPQLLPWVVNTAKSALGALSFAVADEDGQPLPGVLATLTGGRVRRTAETDLDGRAVFFNLSPGAYDLRTELLGFNPSVQSGIEVRAGRSTRLTVVMGIAALREEIAVKAKVAFDDLPAAAVPEEAEEDMDTETAQASDRTVAAVFTLKGRQSVPSSSEQKKVTIAVQTLTANKEFLAVPKLAETVFLTAKLTNTAGLLLLPGKASVFYDEEYISTAVLPQVVPNESFSVNVGEVPGMKVKWQLLGKTRTEAGLIGKKVKLVYDTKITAENLLDSAQTLLIRDQVPVTTSKDVTIEVLQVSPPAQKNTDEAEERNGFLTWSLDLQPKEKKEIRLKFQVTHPRGSPLIDMSE